MPGLEIERAKQVFRFLKAFAERKLPIRRTLSEQLWQLRLRDLPKHSSIAIGIVTLSDGDNVDDRDTTAQEPLIRVRRPPLTSPPGPPISIAEWLESAWKTPDGRIEALQSRTFNRDGEIVTEDFTASPARVAALTQWTPIWNAWAKAELPAFQAMKIFQRLYELRGRVERDSESVELLLGDGRLRWRTVAGVVDHPILLQRVELIFDPRIPEFQVVDADRAPELYGALLQSGDGLAANQLNQLRMELERSGYHPLAGPETDAYLARLAPLLDAHGAFLNQYSDQPAAVEPVLMRDPVLFLRTRLSGFPAAFDRVLEDLDNGQELPISITRLVGIEPAPTDNPDPPPASPWGEPSDILLSKPANLEQIHIARALERHRAVLVQGPPGTGKSHTIANLIGHLVAQGKRVLVTSHTTKALRVLRDQIVDSLQPLAVAVLDKDLESRTQMEGAVRGILARLTVSTDEILEQEASQFREKRANLNFDIDRLTSELRTARWGEYEPIVLAGESIAPGEAGRWVRAHAGGNNWIPGPLESGAPLPLTVEDLRKLYELNSLLTEADEREINARLPDLDTLPSTEKFASILKIPRAQHTSTMARIWPRRAEESDIAGLQDFQQALASFTTDLDALASWQRTLVVAGHTGTAEWRLWDNMAQLVTEAHQCWEARRTVLVEFEVQETGEPQVPDGLAIAQEILRYLEGHSAVGRIQLLLHPKWKALMTAFRVNGRRPVSLSDFKAIEAHLEVLESRDRWCGRWSRQAEPIGLPTVDVLGGQPEPAALAYVQQFRGLSTWWKERSDRISAVALSNEMDLAQFRQSHFASSVDVLPFERDINFVRRALTGAVQVRLAAAEGLRAARQLHELEQALEGYEGNIVTALRATVLARDPAAYDMALAELRRVSGKRAIWQARQDLTSRLGSAAPSWATALRNREEPHGGSTLPGDPVKAWRLRQLHQELELRAALDETALTRQLEQRRQELREATAELIDRQAWLAQLKRTDLQARQALQGWADTVRKIGKGTGKRTAPLQAKARQLLVDARNAVPVWIMPLTRVAESFDPRQPRFDVVIVDEASQSDIQGLLAWYLGDRIAIVGDHEQVSPLAVGQELEAIRVLIAEHLDSVPNSHLYDGTTSVYDFGRQSFGGTIALREHFRCVPDIIEFSNELAYNFEIQPLRNPSTAQRPHVVEFLADSKLGTERDGKTNLAEARAIAALMKASMALPDYADKTFGAITLLGDEQAGLIQQLALELIGAVELDRRRFVAGNSAQFQGDERDVVFLSMVDSPTGTTLRISQSPAMKQRYNVAASRAKDQLWLVHSLNPSRDLQAGDLRRRLIDHVRDPGARRRDLEKAKRRTESPFEVAVLERLVAAGYRVEAQVWVGKYRIDFVVGDGAKQVAVECDGDRYHGYEQIPEDMARQAVLERAGWRFIRIRGTKFFRDPDGTMDWAFSELKKWSIEPATQNPTDIEVPSNANDLTTRIVRHAWEIMREQQWLAQAGAQQAAVPAAD